MDKIFIYMLKLIEIFLKLQLITEGIENKFHYF